MRGRKPIPTHLKIVKGTARGHARSGDTISFNSADVPPPPNLDDDGKTEWERVAKILSGQSLLTEADVSALSAYCHSWSVFKRATESLKQLSERDKIFKGLISRTTNGNLIQNPLIGIANKAAADVVKFASEFGMTPSARARLHVEKSFENQDLAEKFFA
jgi:P27 family predicted phage terminase small subunit